MTALAQSQEPIGLTVSGHMPIGPIVDRHHETINYLVNSGCTQLTTTTDSQIVHVKFKPAK